MPRMPARAHAHSRRYGYFVATHTHARRSNGWIARNTFTLTARATPDWASFGLKLAPSREALAEDVHLWSTAVSAVLQRMADMHRSFDLEDARKTI